MTWSPADLDGFEDYVRGRAAVHLRTATLLTGDPGDAEDLVQTVLARLAVSWTRVSRVESLDSYVRRSLVNAHLSSRRRRRVRTVPMLDPLADAATGAGDPSDRLLLWESLRRLPPRQRAVIVLRFWEDLSEHETAGILRCSTGTVKSQAAKALAKLRADSGLDLLSPHPQKAETL